MFDLEMLGSLSIEQASIVCDFILYFLRHSTCLQLGIHLNIQVKRFVHLMKNIMII